MLGICAELQYLRFLTDLQNKTWALFNNSNTLYPGVFPGIRKFEAELVTMVLGIVHGHENGAVGLLSSGGTESILLAVLAYREQARARGITEPEIICGISAHPAVYKACHVSSFWSLLLVSPSHTVICLSGVFLKPHCVTVLWGETCQG